MLLFPSLKVRFEPSLIYFSVVVPVSHTETEGHFGSFKVQSQSTAPVCLSQIFSTASQGPRWHLLITTTILLLYLHHPCKCRAAI